jgi:hypothetical protein
LEGGQINSYLDSVDPIFNLIYPEMDLDKVILKRFQYRVAQIEGDRIIPNLLSSEKGLEGAMMVILRDFEDFFMLEKTKLSRENCHACLTTVLRLYYCLLNSQGDLAHQAVQDAKRNTVLPAEVFAHAMKFAVVSDNIQVLKLAALILQMRQSERNSLKLHRQVTMKYLNLAKLG